MGFRDLDAIESMMGKPVENMTDTELVSYLKSFMKARQGLNLPISGQRERAIMACLKRTYGGKEAGRLVKWVMWKHGGKVDGKPILYSTFSKGMRWRTDLWFVQMQEFLKKEASLSTATPQFSSLGDL